MKIDRRAMVGGMLAGIAAGRAAAQGGRDPFEAIVASTNGGRLGLAAWDTGSGRRISVNGGGRFALCSTFKMPLAAAILREVDRGRLRLDQPIRFGAGDVLAHAPVVRANLAAGQLGIGQLCDAAVVQSDNSAANLLLPQIGGPGGLTRFFRDQGDRVSRLDRDEPTLNQVRGDEVRDTTTPFAMLGLMERILVGDTLSAASRERLIGWMVATTTGKARLRAGLPTGWRSGDKTGTSGDGWYNDIAFAVPPGRKPILIACYLDAPDATPAAADAAHAAVGRLVGQLFA